MTRLLKNLCCCLGLVTFGGLTTSLIAQQGAKHGEWPSYAGDMGSTKYSNLSEIGKDNVQDLQIMWKWRSVDYDLQETNPDLNLANILPVTPLKIGNILYTSTNVGQAVAIHPATGETLWVYDALADGAGTVRGLGNRGLSYWTDGADERILLMSGEYLVALNAKTGKPVPEFGEQGKVNLTPGMGPRLDKEFRWNAAPVVCRDVVVVGAALDDTVKVKEQAPGYVRGYDVRTGELRWQFNPIPQPGDVGNETWENGSWEYSGAANVWTLMSADEELGYVYLPHGTPTNDWYGGHRLGDNLFAESLVCLECETGEYVWHFQMVHHGLWDYDTASAPNLVDITVNGKQIKAVAQITKQGFTFVFDRITGEPVWPIEERPVPQSNVSGERTAPTQPFPTKPPPFERQGLTIDDLIDFTPELRAQAVEAVGEYVYGPLFTPPSLSGNDPNETKGTIQLPGWVGGADWNGAAFDPETHILYIPSITAPVVVGLVQPDPDESNLNYVRGGNRSIEVPSGLPIVKPPWGRITAIDLDKGEHVWMVANGDGPRDHPELKDLDLPKLGAPGRPAPLLTKTLLFLGDGTPDAVVIPPFGGGRMFRAYDKSTGEVLWETELPAGTTGAPMTYTTNGKQYVVVAIGDREHKAELIAFSLPYDKF